MKALILMGILTISFVSCKKSNNISPNIFGKWEVRRQHHGNTRLADSVYKPGNGNIIQFNSDGTYNRYLQGQLTASGMYHITKNGFSTNQNSYDELSFDSDPSFTTLVILNGDMLTLRPIIPDIGATDYQKIPD